MKHTRLLLPVVLIGTLVVGFFAGFQVLRDDDFFALRKNYQVFGALYEELLGGYVDDLDAQKLMRTGIDAMLADLDPYTNFFDEADNADMNVLARGRLGGVGLNAGLKNGRITVVAPQEGASAYKQGVRAGDIITHIGEQSTDGLSLQDVYNLMRGEPGTAVQIILEREGAPAPLLFLLTREAEKSTSVTYTGFVNDDTLAGLGYIRLERFGLGASAEVRTAVQALLQTGALRGLLLDLRDNPGGLLDAAVEITQLFVPQGSVIVSTRGRLAQTERVYRSKMPPLVPDLPLAVLVSEYSASASEIVAGAIQDLDRGLIVGVPTFGKGLVQIVRPLPYNTSLKLTTARYYIPSGRSIQAIDYGRHDGNFTGIPDSLRTTFKTMGGREVKDGRGIEPDVPVSFGEPSALEEALNRRAAFFFFANHFAAQHPAEDAEARFFRATTPGGPLDFVVTDEVLADFQKWLQAQNFSYRTPAEYMAEDLSDRLTEMGYDRAHAEMAALQAAVEREKANDFKRHEDRLKERLRAEILARYTGTSAQVKASLGHDVQVQRALALLQDPRAYSDLLNIR